MVLTYDALEPVNDYSKTDITGRAWSDSAAFRQSRVSVEIGDAEVVLMAGGNGKRLAPLTDERPKPLPKVGSRPIIDTIVGQFAALGFGRIWLSVNYLGDMIEEYFGNGADWDVEIRYLRETVPLGTAGALSLLPRVTKSPIVEAFTPVHRQGCMSTTIDAMVEGGMPIPTHIKIDVDGFEDKVIAGGMKTLERGETATLLVEINKNLEGHRMLVDYLETLGYKVDDKTEANFIFRL